METITVIIPVYNAGAALERCIRSVLAQSHQSLELILVNDGSTDGSGQVCAGFATADQRVRVFHQENAGVSAARNRGLSHASGAYVTFLDADDVVPADYLAVLHDACRGNDVALCDVVSIQDDRELVRFTHPEAVLSQKEALDLLLTRKKINSGPCAKLFRREILEGLLFPPLKAYEDILFVRDAFCRAGRIGVTDRTEYRYIQNPQGAMSAFFKAPSPDIVRATEELLRFIGTRPDLSPETFYITASHLMQYVLPLLECGDDMGCGFIRGARDVYRRHAGGILRCSAFPWKEKILFLLFAWGWHYTGHRIKRIGG